MTRTGKIARFPHAIRDQLNHRLDDGEPGPQLLAWLNQLPEVQQVLTEHFGSRPVSEQNLSEWRQGGFEDWLRHEDARAWVAQLTEQSDELRQDSGALSLADRVAYPAMLALCGLLQRNLVSADIVEQRHSIISAAHQLTQLRRATYQAEKVQLERERWAAKQEEARQRTEHRAEMLRLEQERNRPSKEEVRQDVASRTRSVPNPIFDSITPEDLAYLFPEEMLTAAAKLAAQRNLEGLAPSRPHPTASGQIAPDQTKSNHFSHRPKTSAPKPTARHSRRPHRSRAARPSRPTSRSRQRQRHRRPTSQRQKQSHLQQRRAPHPRK